LTHHRHMELLNWLQQKTQLKSEYFELISGDASFRRYFRFKCGEQSFIGVDAPPDKENCRPFVAIANAFLSGGLQVPQVYFVDYQKGFMALSDLGDQQLLPLLNESNVEGFYGRALEQIVRLQTITQFKDYKLPDYNVALLNQEMQLFPDWFLKQHLNYALTVKQTAKLSLLFERLTDIALKQPQVTVHRDFHSRNLMVVDDKSGSFPQLAMIDFQDAVKGPVTYDLISLIKDSYISWPWALVQQWALLYHQMLKNEGMALPSQDEFIFWMDSMAIQRHLKVVGIFSRLNYRDGKAGYLADIPQTLQYIVEAGERHPEYKEIAEWIEKELMQLMVVQGALIQGKRS